jgi:hypothetical protein
MNPHILFAAVCYFAGRTDQPEAEFQLNIVDTESMASLAVHYLLITLQSIV